MIRLLDTSPRKVRSLRQNRYRLTWERLEDRTLLSGAGEVFFPFADEVEPFGSASPVGFTPTQIKKAYGFDLINFGGIVGDGTGQTIAVVNAYDNPKLVSSTDPNYLDSDLHKFSAFFGLPDPPSFTKLNQTGGTTYPQTRTDWALEAALDVQWIHALAPKAHIVLVETNSGTISNMLAGVQFAATLPNVTVISMSWGTSEYSSEVNDNAKFLTPAGHAGITFVAATGNDGSPGTFPAYSPNVLAVGATRLTLNPDNSYLSEVGWSDSGGGNSLYQNKPTYQNAVNTTTKRSIPDVSFNGDTSTGVAVYDSFNNGSTNPWVKVGGTSFSTPAWAALIGIANQGRQATGDGTLANTAVHTLLYGAAATNYHDITSGNNGSFSAGAGYDRVTGLGTPFADRLMNVLVTSSIGLSGNVAVTEGGAGSSYTVFLRSQPTANVSLTINPGTELGVSPTTLVFTSSNWATPQTVTVSAVDDFVARGVHTATIAHSTTSSDPKFQGKLANLTATLTDNDFAGVVLSPSGGTTEVVEGQPGDTYTIRLSSQPQANVVLTPTNSELVRTPGSLTFTSANWNQPQTVTVSKTDDVVAQGVHTAIVTHAGTSTDAAYQNANLGSLSVTVIDNDTSGVLFTQSGPDTSVSEGGAGDDYTVRLESQPTAAVTVTLNSGGALNLTPATLTFTPANWNTSQTVAVSAVDDIVAQGVRNVGITHSGTSTDPTYQNPTLGNMSVTVIDNDSPGVNITATDGSTSVTEWGTTDTILVRLLSAPAADVTVNLQGGSLLSVSQNVLHFSATDWDVPQQVEVAAFVINGTQGPRQTTIATLTASEDEDYDGLPDAVPVSVTDVLQANITRSILITQTAGSTQVSEAGATDTFLVRLNSRPATDVTIHLNGNNLLLPSVPVFTFTPTTWNKLRTITVRALNDVTYQGTKRVAQVLAATSADSTYEGLEVSVPVNRLDNDRAGLIIAQTAKSTKVVKGGAGDTYTLRLSSQPTADVTIDVPADGQFAVSPAQVVFTPSDWNVPRSYTVNAVADGIQAGPRRLTLLHDVSSDDPFYAGLTAAGVAGLPVIVTDFTPTLTPIASRAVAAAAITGANLAFAFTVGDADTNVNLITFTASSSNQAIAANGGLQVVGSGPKRTLLVAPQTGIVGFTTITLSAFDGNTSVTKQFDLQLAGNATLPHQDGFDQDSLVFLGGTWATQLGRFANSAGHTSALVTGNNLALLNGPLAGNVAVQADVNVAGLTTKIAGVALRASGPAGTSSYYAQLVHANGTDFVQIWRMLKGVKKLLASSVVSASSGTLRFEAVGSSLKAFLDSTLVAQASDGTLKTGKVGVVGSAGGLIDNFSAELL